MSKNIVLDGMVYRGVSTIEFPTEDGGTARMIETDSVPSGSVTITENGTHDVTGYAEAVVNVEAESGGSVGGYDINGLINRSQPSGDLVHTDPSATSFKPYAFSGCTGITSFESEHITTADTNVFSMCTGLKRVSLPKMTALKQNFFYNCSALESVNLPAVANINAATVFQQCASLKSISLPSANTATGMTIFQSCTALEFADLGFVTSVNAYLFDKCSALKTIVLRNTALVSLANVSAFNKTPFASGGTGGSIYVPSTLIDTYKSATNWSTIDGYGTITWVALEGSEYE